jgi:hypothetical protein
MRKNELSLQLGLSLVFFLLATQATAALQMQKSLSCTGTITAVNLGVYQDPACTMPILRVDWGTVEPASTNNQIIYVKNTGNTQETLSMSTENWTPTEASQYLILSWNASGIVLQPSTMIAAESSLLVAVNTVTLESFTFTGTITGTQTR